MWSVLRSALSPFNLTDCSLLKHQGELRDIHVCVAEQVFFFFNKVHLCAIEWNIPCYSSYTHKYHKTMFLVITASP